jgi:hypothetical protein
MNDIARVKRTLHTILLLGMEDDSEPHLMFRARALIDDFKTVSAADPIGSEARAALVASALVALRDAVDRELDHRLDDDLTDTLTDLLEDVSLYLHRETGCPNDARPGDKTAASR